MGRPKGSKTSDENKKAQLLSKMLKLYLKGVPINVIAVCVNIPPSTVRLRLRPFRELLKNEDKIATYVDFKVLLFNAVELKLLQSLMSEEKLSKAQLNHLAYAFDKIVHARRLEEDKSTQNLSNHGIREVVDGSKYSEE